MLAENQPRLFILSVEAIAITLVSVYGTRILGFFPTKAVRKFLGYEKMLFVFPTVILFQFLALFTLQRSGGLNVFNFFIVSVIFLALNSAIILATLKNGMVVVLLGTVFLMLTIPRVVYELNSYFNGIHNGSLIETIPSSELQALLYVREKIPQNAIVQASPFNSRDHTVSYVAYLSDHYSYVSGEGYLESHNQPFQGRERRLKDIFNREDTDLYARQLRRLHISYLYLLKDSPETSKFIGAAGLKTVYENDKAVILHVQ
jgi:hypothetical protein